MATPELLGVVLRDARIPNQTLEAISGFIEGDGPAPRKGRVHESVLLAELPQDHARVLAASLELARRIAAAPWPTVVRGPEDIAAIALRELGALPCERVLAVVCDAANRPLRTVVVAEGAVDRCPIPIREIVTAVLQWGGRAFAIAHNHPGGDAEPSEADTAATRAVAEAARAVGLRFCGHVVVGDGGAWAVAR